MFDIKLLKSFMLFFLVLLATYGYTSVIDIQDGNPTIIMHDTVIAPGELLLQVDALNFIGDNGQVAAITLSIEIDTFLIDFVSLQNPMLPGSWLGNYNTYQNEITITFTAPFGTGYDIDGKLFDLKLEYYGGFTGELHFKPTCEISNVSLQTIQGVIYEDGSISQTQAVGEVSQDTIIAYYDQSFTMPVTAVGAGYNAINEIELRIEYDTTQIEFEGFTEASLSGIIVMDSGSILTIHWQDTISSVDFTALDTIVKLDYIFIGDSNSILNFLPGSKMFNDGVVVASDFIDGFLKASLFVDIINYPDTAGTSTGEGYYFINDLVTVVATPEDGFHFQNWTQYGNIISENPIYSFIKQGSNDTLMANYEADSSLLSIVSLPISGGEAVGEGYYQFGEQVLVMAIPNEGFEFVQWLYGNDTVSVEPVYEFIMPNYNMELVAIFDTLKLIINAEPNNTAYGSVDGFGIFNYGENATLTAVPFASYKFVAWTENSQVVSVDLVYTFTVFDDRDLVANFQVDTDCSAPIGLFVNNLSETEAELNWLPSGGEQEWDILWGETGFDTLSGGMLVEGLSETHYLLEDLDPGTSYDFYVRAICSTQLHSSWSDVSTFSTWFVGVGSNKDIELFTIFPNPVEGELNVILNSQSQESILYRVINLVGVPVKNGEVTAQYRLSVDLVGIDSGVYCIQLIVGNRRLTKLFIKK